MGGPHATAFIRAALTVRRVLESMPRPVQVFLHAICHDKPLFGAAHHMLNHLPALTGIE